MELLFYAGKTVTDGINRYVAGWCPTKTKSDAMLLSWIACNPSTCSASKWNVWWQEYLMV
jgi:hypothetical protein